MQTEIYGMTFEVNGDTLQLEQDAGCGDVDRMTLHRSQVALLAEQMGIVTAPVDQAAQHAIAMLTRRLNVLHHRIGHLAHWLMANSDSEHADLSYEQTYATATAEISEQFCFDLLAMPPGLSAEPVPDADSEPRPHGVTAPSTPAQAALI